MLNNNITLSGRTILVIGARLHYRLRGVTQVTEVTAIDGHAQ